MSTAAPALKAIKVRETKGLSDFFPVKFIESAPGVFIDKAARTARVVLITEGLGNLRDKNYYTRAAVESAPAVFNGKQFYVDHPSRSDEEDRPERTVRDLGGYFYECQVGDVRDPVTGDRLRACFAMLKFSESGPGQLALEQATTAVEYQRQFPNSKDVYCGISVNAGGLAEPGRIDGMDVNLVQRFQDAFSADIVTKPARGGKFLNLMREAEQTAAWKRARGRARAKEDIAMPDATVVQTIEAKQAEAFRLHRAAVLARTKATESGAAKDVTAAETAETRAREAAEAATESLEMDMPMGGGEMPSSESDGAMDMSALAEALPGKFKALGEALGGAREHGGPPVHDDDGGHGAGDGRPRPPAATGSPTDPDGDGDIDVGPGAAIGDTDHDRGSGVPGGGGSPKPPEDLNMLIADIKADLAALSDHLDGLGGGGAGGDGAGADGGMGMDAGAGAGDGGMMDSDGGGRPMRYKCTACGEDNDVLPPKGYTLTRVGESHKLAGGKLKEAYLNAVDKLDKKEERFLEANRKIAAVSALAESEKKRADDLAEKVAKFERRDRAVKAFREAIDPKKGGLTPDLISVQELLGVQEALWPSLISMKQSKQKVETRLAESIPAGAGGFYVGGAQPTTAKEAIAAAKAAQAQQ